MNRSHDLEGVKQTLVPFAHDLHGRGAITTLVRY
jgi:hypothetical protein